LGNLAAAVFVGACQVVGFFVIFDEGNVSIHHVKLVFAVGLSVLVKSSNLIVHLSDESD